VVFACCWLAVCFRWFSVRSSVVNRWRVWLWVSRAGAAVVIGGGGAGWHRGLVAFAFGRGAV